MEKNKTAKRLDPPEEERRDYLKTVGALVAGLAIGGAAGWLSKPAEGVTETVTETVTKTVTAAITPTPTPTALTGTIKTILPPNAWGEKFEEVIGRIVKSKYPGLTSEVEVVPWEASHAKITTALGAKAPLQLHYMGGGRRADLILNEWVEPLDDYPGLAEVEKRFWKEQCKLLMPGPDKKPHYYWIPFWVYCQTGHYNKEMLDKAGIDRPPETWPEFLEDCLKIKEEGIAEYPWVFALTRAEETISSLLSYWASWGLWFASEKEIGDPIFNSPKHKEALQFIVDALNVHEIISPAALETDETSATRIFSAGEAPFYVTAWGYGTAIYWDPTRSKVADVANTFLIPGTGRPGDPKTGCMAGGSGFGIPNYNTQPIKDATWEVLKELTGYEAVKEIFMYAAENQPAIPELYQDEDFLARSPRGPEPWQNSYYEWYFLQVNEAGKFAQGMPDVPWFPEAREIMLTELHKALLLEKTVDEALDYALERTEKAAERWK